ncbi:DNA translocase FtsK [uncultured Gammaproteobacteria bacterium]
MTPEFHGTPVATPGDKPGQRSGRASLLPAAVAAVLKWRMTEFIGLGVMLCGVTLGLIVLTYDHHDPSWNTAALPGHSPRNLFGISGAYIADVLQQFLGKASSVLPILIIAWGVRIASHMGLPKVFRRMVQALLGTLLAAAALAALPLFGSWPMGSKTGGAAGDILLGLTDRFGLLPSKETAAVIAAALAVWMLGGALGFSIIGWISGMRVLGAMITDLARLVGATAWTIGHNGAQIAAQIRGFSPPPPPAGTASGGEDALWSGILARFRILATPPASASSSPFVATTRREPGFGPGTAASPGDASPSSSLSSSSSPMAELFGSVPRPRVEPVVQAPVGPPEPSRRAQAEKQSHPVHSHHEPHVYHLPAFDLLQPAKVGGAFAVDEEGLKRNAEMLLGVLGDFGVRGIIQKVSPGPVVTLYELEPAPGTKSSRVIGLADDIARSMSAVSVRVAVVPGRNVIGIELPNLRRETVFLRELLEAEAYERANARLPLVLGKDISGAPIVADLARFPHLLVAGTTGSGKSVAINTMILSLLYRLRPDQCRFIMVDPKMLELSVYEGIPHLLSAVVTDPKKAVVALKWAVREMESRYRDMSKLGVRNIEGFNARVREARERGEPLTRRVQTGFDPDTHKPLFEEQPLVLRELHYIVVIVDEMADLMLVAGKDIEAVIQRLAQMARAAGIHLIMATQRPSVDVITGTIKANFPTRISFQVTSKIDSRTILSEMGAEQLLGQGDMLYMAGGGRITRIHGPFVADEEVEKVVAYLKTQGEPDYVDAVTEEIDDDGEDGKSGSSGGGASASGGGGAGNGEAGNEDELYDRAVAVVSHERKASTSFIQRQLRIGYNGAARLIERMEREGVVSKPNHSGKREVLTRSAEE